jgi:hypothetical protein
VDFSVLGAVGSPAFPGPDFETRRFAETDVSGFAVGNLLSRTSLL